MKTKKLKILSGGQSGVDRAALDFALQNKIECGGWCPHGRLTEDGPISSHYPLKETASTNYADRTRLNIEDSDGTLIIYQEQMDEGTRYTLDHAKEKQKPVFIISGSPPFSTTEFSNWIKVNRIRKLNVAGPRESNCPGIFNYAMNALKALFPESDSFTKLAKSKT